MGRVAVSARMGGRNRRLMGDYDRATRLGAAMITVWFFLAMFYSDATALAQAGPFVSLEQCEAARKVWVESSPKRLRSNIASECYQGVIK